MSDQLLVFDMDGVLVDVSESYRETIARTVKHFSGVDLTRRQIQDYKNQGGWNDDWKLSHHAIAEAGVDVPLERVIDYFQSIFLGNGTDGLILRERWVARPGVLERLNRRFRFAVFTGRPKAEAELTLRRFAGDVVFHPVIGMHEVENHKPAPDGLLHIGKLLPRAELWYVGDTVDDARSAKAAGVPFIGIAAPTSARREELCALLREEGARAVLDDINQLEDALTL